MPIEDAFAWTSELSAQLFTTDDAKEGMASFLEKRPAAWVQPAPERGARP
jgi:methylglutaconyl-CoA hydratase